MTQDSGSQHTRPVASYPRHQVVSVIDNLQEAEQAVKALQDAGYNAKDIRLISYQDFIEAFRELQQQHSSLSRLVHIFLKSYDEGFAGEMYLQQAQQGHAILTVHIPEPEQMNQVRDILVNYHAHLIKYFGRWTITDLPS